MSIFGRIANRIFGRASYEEPSSPAGSAQAATPASATAGTAPMAGGAMGGAAAASGAGAAAATTPSMAGPGAQPGAGTGMTSPAAAGQPVDVEAVLTGMAQGKGNLNWRTSIVDLMKVLDLDSSLDARKELATELGYTGAKDGSAEMNIWLHKAVMKKLAENGGVVPASMRD